MPRPKINLALQGGGAHGAFTWGVLDRLLQEPDLQIGCISAASAGAVNAVALAAGIVDGGQEGARARLDAVWEAVLKAQVPDFMRGVARISLTQILNLFSPYEFNPLGFDPLRSLLSEQIDFGRIRANAPFELLISATEVATGRARLFRRHEITVDTVLASACLPTLHHAMVIDGVAYWDGGFSANPDLVTLAGEGHAEDTLIVLLNTLDAGSTPTRPSEIAAQVNALTGGAGDATQSTATGTSTTVTKTATATATATPAAAAASAPKPAAIPTQAPKAAPAPAAAPAGAFD